MPATYSYRARVLAALDAHYNPQRPSPISLRSIDSRYESDCNVNRLFLPPSWRKRVKITLDKLVSDGFLTENNNCYTLLPRLRTIITEEKVRLNVNQRNHEWRVFAGVIKKMELSPAAYGGNATSSSTPAARTRNRTSLSAAEIPNSVASPLPRPVSLRTSGKPTRRVRYSDPGPLLTRVGPTSSATGTRKRRSIGTPSGASGASAPTSRSIPVVSPRRRRSIIPARGHRRHTLAVAPTRQRISSPEPVSQEIQFFPLKQALSARTRRALRRNALSEEMNDIDAEKRVGQKRNREELARLRAELAESSERLRELERELAAVKYAPSEEPEPLSQINEEQDGEGDYDMGNVPADSPEPHVSLSPIRGNSASAELRAGDMEIGRALVSHRDRKIRDLESMIEVLRKDIAQRGEEERLRAQEDEVFHDAEEQILHEENHALAEKNEELTTAKSKTVTFDDDVHGLGLEEDDDGYGGIDQPIDGLEDSTMDIEEVHTISRSWSIDSGDGQTTEISDRIVGVDPDDKVADLETQNSRLQRTIDTQGQKIQKMAEDLEGTLVCVDEHEKALSKLKRENEKLRVLEKEMEEKVTELEEMEGERLENVRHMVVQTNDMVDQEKTEMEEKIDGMVKQVLELQDMIKIVTEEKREAEARIAIAISQAASLQTSVEAGRVEKLRADSEIEALTMQIAELEDTASQENQEASHKIHVANAHIAELQQGARVGEAAKIQAEAKILAATNQANELEAAVSEERAEIEGNILELESAFEAGKVAKIESETQIATLRNQIKDHETLVSDMKYVAEAQISDLQVVIESSKIAKAEAEGRILTLANQIKDLKTTAIQERERTEITMQAANDRIANLRETIEASQAAKVDAEERILELKSQVRGLELDSSTLATERDEMRKEVNELSERLGETEKEMMELRDENAGMKREVEVLVQKGRGFEEVSDILRRDKVSLEGDVEGLKDQVEELEAAAEALRKAKIFLEIDSNSLNARLVSQQKTADLAESTRENLQQDVTQLRFHIKVFKQAADIARAEKESFEQEIISLQAQVSFLENAQKLAGDENQIFRKDIEELHAQIGTFEQAIEAAGQKKEQLEVLVAGLNVEIEALKKAEIVAKQQKEALEHNLVKLKAQLAQVREELDASYAENSLLRQEINGRKSEVESLRQLLGLSDREKEDLHRGIQGLEIKLISLEGSDKQNRELRIDNETLRMKINTLNQAVEIANAEKLIIQQKIRPYIQNEQSLDTAIEEVLTELVMAKNRADENERIKTELSNKIKILAQEDDDNNAELISPEEMVEKLTDRFGEVRDSVEKLYELCRQDSGGPFGGYNLEDFAWAGSNESALIILGELVGDMYQKVTDEQTRAEKMRDGWEKDKEQQMLYGSYLDNIATTVSGSGQGLPKKDQVLSLVTHRLSALKRQIKVAEEKAEELSGSLARKDNTIKDLELNVDKADQHGVELNKKLIDSISAHSITTACLDRVQADVRELNKVIGDKNEEIEKLEAAIDQRTKRERELLGSIEQQRVSHKTTISRLEQDRDGAIAGMEKQLANMQEAKTSMENLAGQAREKNATAVKILQDCVAISKIEIEEKNETLRTMKASHREIVERLEGRLAQSKGDLAEVSRKLHEAAQKSSSNILALKIKLKSSSDETKRQQSSWAKAVTERDNATKQLDAEMRSSQSAITSLEEKIQTIQLDAKARDEGSQKTIVCLRAELQIATNTAETERKNLQGRIHSSTKKISELKDRIDELERTLEEAEDSEKALEEHIKTTESQSQLFKEQAAKSQQVIEAEKESLLQELAELRNASDAVQIKMQTDITALEAVVWEKSQHTQELEIGVSILQDEKSKLEVEQKKNDEMRQDLTSELNKVIARFGDVNNQSAKDSHLRQAERPRNERKRTREEQDEEELKSSMRLPPTPASSVIAGLKAVGLVNKKENKRRRYDSGIGVEEEDEEFEGFSQVGA